MKCPCEKHSVDKNSISSFESCELCENDDLVPLYSVCHCKDCKSTPHSLVLIRVKFNMVSNLIKVCAALEFG